MLDCVVRLGFLRQWILDGKEDVSMATLAEEAFDSTPTADERRLMEGHATSALPHSFMSFFPFSKK